MSTQDQTAWLGYVSEFQRGPGGKHEEFISFVSDPQPG
jgi:hypothetical protein